MAHIDLATEEADGILEHSLGVNSDGVEYRIGSCPRRLIHPYLRPGVGESATLYSGAFQVSGLSASFTGEVLWNWLPTPKVVAQGSTTGGYLGDLPMLASRDSSFVAELVLPQDIQVPIESIETEIAPEAPVSYRVKGGNATITEDVQPLTVGDTDVDAVKFLIPNGWKSHDGYAVVDPDGLPTRGRTEIEYAGWRLRIDKAGHSSKEFRSELGRNRSFGVTHTGRLSRISGETFQFDFGCQILARVNFALSLLAGRYTAAVLPVGQRDGELVAARWAAEHVIDAAFSVHNMTDETEAAGQAHALITAMLAATEDPLNHDVARMSLAYLLQANSPGGAELAVGACVAGLLLLAHVQLVEDGSMSSTQFKDMHADDLIRELLTHYAIGHPIPSHFHGLAKVEADLFAVDGKHRDGLGCVVKMRNMVEHPRRDRLNKWSTWEWHEASLLARDLLELALLRRMSYLGTHAARTRQNKYAGTAVRVPWASS